MPASLASKRALRLSLIPFLFVLALAARGADSGETLARQGASGAPPCVTCHGIDGRGNAAGGFPSLAGLSADYQAKQLHDFASGKRANPIMAPIAKALSDEQIQAVAEYYAGLDAGSGQTDQQSSDKVAALPGRDWVVNGHWQANQPACVACHGDGARGVGNHFPALAGQHAGYLEAQLKAWQSGQRKNDAGGLMAAVANAMTEQQIKEVAAYLSALPATGEIPEHARSDLAPRVADALNNYFQPPLLKDLPDDEFGASVRRGADIFRHTSTDAEAGRYVGNGQSCVNCHMNNGRQANAAPMWAAWGQYPAWRGKNQKVNTMAERLQGCFTYSQNAQASEAGQAPAADSQVIVDLMSFMFWQSKSTPTGEVLPGRGYPELDKPAQPFSPERGAGLYAEHCALCHGDDGQGTTLAKRRYQFPPLWGDQAFNWGAGMHRVNTAAAFIQANMPLGKPGSLSVQQAWDLAAFITSQPRPQDPRFKGDLDATIKDFHGNRAMDYYGKTVNGYHLGAPGTLEQWRKERTTGR